MLGINIVLDFISTNELRSLIGLVAIGFGIYNLYIYFRDRKKENGCSVVDEAKRKNIIDKMKKIKNSKNFFFALGGIVLLAISVNMVELACSAGFPTIFSEILVQNNVTGILRIIYLLIYVVFYMIDDMVVFTISVCTLSIAGVTTKYNKLVKIIGGLLMLIMGLLLIFKPEWIMLNF
jgi:cytochrome c biogenesis protein CcdA